MTALLSGGIDIGLIGAETSIYVAGQNPNDKVINFIRVRNFDENLQIPDIFEVNYGYSYLFFNVFCTHLYRKFYRCMF